MAAEQGQRRRKSAAALPAHLLLEFGHGAGGSVCGCATDPDTRQRQGFGELGELIAFLHSGQQAGGPAQPTAYAARPRHCQVSILYRQHHTVQGVAVFDGEKYPFRSGMELLYLLREAADCRAEGNDCDAKRKNRRAPAV